MLLNRAELAGLAGGKVIAVFRRWRQPRVKAGSTLRTAIGVVAIEGVEPTTLAAITDRGARAAGRAGRAELLAELAKWGGGRVYRIRLRLAGDDPRVALRRRAELSESDAAALSQRVARLGARSDDGPWGRAILRLIAERPAVRAADLARRVGMDIAHFKPRVRQLKELGLTESLEVGYRLSPRGAALLRRLRSADARPGVRRVGAEPRRQRASSRAGAGSAQRGAEQDHRLRLMRFPSAVRRDPAIAAWLDEHASELGAIAQRWFAVMRDCGDDVRELLHDGAPTACVGDAAFAYVNAFRAHVSVGFFRGTEIADPRRLLEGTGRFMRHVKLGPGRHVDSGALATLIETAYADMRARLQEC